LGFTNGLTGVSNFKICGCSPADTVNTEVRLYDHLFTKEDPDDVPEGADWLANINPKSLERLDSCRFEPYLSNAKAGTFYQFERIGYFCADTKDSSPGKLVFNRSVTLRDTRAKVEKGAKRS
jgi:glutaminyl-tRNA synthetase